MSLTAVRRSHAFASPEPENCRQKKRIKCPPEQKEQRRLVQKSPKRSGTNQRRFPERMGADARDDFHLPGGKNSRSSRKRHPTVAVRHCARNGSASRLFSIARVTAKSSDKVLAPFFSLIFNCSNVSRADCCRTALVKISSPGSHPDATKAFKPSVPSKPRCGKNQR